MRNVAAYTLVFLLVTAICSAVSYFVGNHGLIAFSLLVGVWLGWEKFCMSIKVTYAMAMLAVISIVEPLIKNRLLFDWSTILLQEAIAVSLFAIFSCTSSYMKDKLEHHRFRMFAGRFR